jgi:hypothetical protein
MRPVAGRAQDRLCAASFEAGALRGGASERRGRYPACPGGRALGVGCAISHLKRGSPVSGARVGSIVSHAREMGYG